MAPPIQIIKYPSQGGALPAYRCMSPPEITGCRDFPAHKAQPVITQGIIRSSRSWPAARKTESLTGYLSICVSSQPGSLQCRLSNVVRDLFWRMVGENMGSRFRSHDEQPIFI